MPPSLSSLPSPGSQHTALVTGPTPLRAVSRSAPTPRDTASASAPLGQDGQAQGERQAERTRLKSWEGPPSPFWTQASG